VEDLEDLEDLDKLDHFIIRTRVQLFEHVCLLLNSSRNHLEGLADAVYVSNEQLKENIAFASIASKYYLPQLLNYLKLLTPSMRKK
jgi:hypothetical protein